MSMLLLVKWIRESAVLIVVGTVACGAVNPPMAPVQALRSDWSVAALHTAERLATRLRNGNIQCQDFAPAAISTYDKEYQGRMPLPAAVAACATHADEDLTFEIFESTKDAEQFIRAKQSLLCRIANANTITGFPGFAYVDGGSWVVEPDEKATADEIAPILGGKSKVASCPAPAP